MYKIDTKLAQIGNRSDTANRNCEPACLFFYCLTVMKELGNQLDLIIFVQEIQRVSSLNKLLLI